MFSNCSSSPLPCQSLYFCFNIYINITTKGNAYKLPDLARCIAVKSERPERHESNSGTEAGVLTAITGRGPTLLKEVRPIIGVEVATPHLPIPSGEAGTHFLIQRLLIHAFAVPPYRGKISE
ncbi:hypothetical protein AVEN_110640-1 [Araneus ventricosus]|uniref:Uncharacterized protein n=1 Tax=Araneus ventricosus TaxID=182803 RepID=A0A4Y2AUW7_ARAVE|nr:hypothetical protein AVEN_110640-1 [Araneus ventricosus]